MSTAAVRAVLEKKASDFAAANDLRIQFENVNFTPPNDAVYLQFFLLPAPSRSLDLAGQITTYLGVVQINIVGFTGIGQGDSDDQGAAGPIATLLEALIKDGTQMTDGTITVAAVSPASAGRGFPDNGRYTIPVSFQYRCDA